MRVLHVNDADLPSRGFGGYDLLDGLASRGLEGHQAVLTKYSNDPRVTSLLNGPEERQLQDSISAAETHRSLDCLLYPWARNLVELPEFKTADVVHYHLINNRVISILDLPWLTSLKPSVWSMHDPWALTGHCIYPRGCDRWLSGCEHCPDLEVPYPMAQDRAGEMWRIKRSAYSRTDADIILASEHTLHMAERSPLGAQFGHVHRIPYGIATSSHLPESERAKSRSALGIPDGNLVLAFRATASEFKGLSHLIEALALERPARPTTLLTVDSLHLVDSLAGDYDIIELGWVREQTLYARFLSACDIFLMPSMAEAFGLMAAEAMAVGRPVICFEGTSLPEITFAPDCGVAVPAGDSKALRVAIDMLASSPSEAMRRGELGRLLAAKHYDHDDYLDSLVTVYRSVVDRRS